MASSRRQTSFAAAQVAQIIQDSDSDLSELSSDEEAVAFHSDSDSVDSESENDAQFESPTQNDNGNTCNNDGVTADPVPSRRRGHGDRGLNTTRGRSRARGYGGVSQCLQWQQYPYADGYEPDWMTGVLVDTSDYKPLDFFLKFFPDAAFELMVDQTNTYALQFFDCPAEMSANSKFKDWEDTSLEEMKAFVALQITMGLVKKNELADYWETWWFSHTPFAEVMSRNQFELLSSFLHFADNNADRPAKTHEDFDFLWKIRPLMKIIEPSYEQMYRPEQSLSIDENMIRFKGKLSIRQYRPAKPTEWGIKLFVLSENQTGYVLKFLTHCCMGSVKEKEGFTSTESVVLSLLEGYQNKGYIVHTDNSYSSPNLFNELKKLNFGAVGTVRPGRNNTSDNHNKNMAGVDPMNQKLGIYDWSHKSDKWYMAMYHRLLEVAMVNSYIVYCKTVANPISQRKFWKEIVDGLLKTYTRKSKKTGRASDAPPLPFRLCETHGIAKFEDPKYKPDCIVCSDQQKRNGWKRKQTSYKCRECKLPMCFMPCHELYHRYRDFKRAADEYVYHKT